jgi:co-chaperonin GroES (HSP10)
MRLIITEKERQGEAIAHALGEVEEKGDTVRYYEVNGDTVIIPAKGRSR